MDRAQNLALNAFLENNENSIEFSPKTTKIVSLFSWIVFAILSSGLNNKCEADASFNYWNSSFLIGESWTIYSEQILDVLDRFKFKLDEKPTNNNLVDTSEIISDIVVEIEEKDDSLKMIEKAIEMEPVIEISLERLDLSKFWFSSTIEEWLKSLILWLIAQESSFNSNSVSSANALWLFQITPSTYNWFKNKYKNDPRFRSIFSWNMNSLLSSVDKQLEFYFLHAYEVQNTFVKSSSLELEKIKDLYFDWNQEIFEENFLKYVLLNAYNTWWQVFNKSMFWDFIDYLDRNFDYEASMNDSLYLFNELTIFLKNKRWNNYWPQAQQYALKIAAWNEIISTNWPRT